MSIINLQVYSLIGLHGMPLYQQFQIVDQTFGRHLDGFEFYTMPGYVQKEHNRDKDSIASILENYSFNTIHVFSNPQWFLGNNEWTRETFKTISFFSKRDLILSAVVHPDYVEDFNVVFTIAQNEGVKLEVEILGDNAVWGNRFDHIKEVLTTFDDIDLVADTAHIYEMMQLGEPSLEAYQNMFPDRLKHIHVSASGNFYKSLGGDTGEIDTAHSLISLKWDRISDFLPCYEQVKDCLLTIEGVVPAGKEGQQMLKAEIELLRRG